MPLRTALAKSKNMVSIRVLQAVGVHNAQDWIARFGFDTEKHPPYLTMALGAGSVTPLQMASAYAVFANGGYRLSPWLVARVTDQKGRTLVETKAVPLDDRVRALDARNAFVMNSLLQEVTRSGTAAKAKVALNRGDIFGKTGTTNDSMDAWFAGYHPNLVAVTWIGYDTPRKLGDRETGGGLSLPVWISFMEHALKGVPVVDYPVPEGVVQAGADWMYEEFSRGGHVRQLGIDADSTSSGDPQPAAPSSNTDEKSRILDLFRN